MFTLMKRNRDDLFSGDNNQFLLSICPVNLQSSHCMTFRENLNILYDHSLNLWTLTFIDDLKDTTIICKKRDILYFSHELPIVGHFPPSMSKAHKTYIVS